MNPSILKSNWVTAPFEIDECSQMRGHTCTHKTSHRPHARPTTPHHSDTLKAFNPMDAGAVGRSWWAVRSPVSAIDPNSEGKGEAYTIKVEWICRLSPARSRRSRTDWWLGGDRRRRRRREGEGCFVTPGQWRGEGEYKMGRGRRRWSEEISLII